MKPLRRFLGKPKSFWACVRSLSQQVGYSKRQDIIVPTPLQMATAFQKLGLDDTKLIVDGRPTALAVELNEYFGERARCLKEIAEPNLMSASQARHEFQRQFAKLRPKCPIPMNKQKGDKKAEAFLTGLVT